MPLRRAFPPEETFAETVPPFSATASAFPSANAAMGIRLPKRYRPVALTNLGVYIGTASGNIDLGVYTWDGSQFVRQASTGSTAASGSNAIQKIAPGSVLTYDGRADVWLFVAADNTTVTMARLSGSAAITNLANRGVLKTSAFPLPSTISGAGSTATPIWIYGGP